MSSFKCKDEALEFDKYDHRNVHASVLIPSKCFICR